MKMVFGYTRISISLNDVCKVDGCQASECLPADSNVKLMKVSANYWRVTYLINQWLAVYFMLLQLPEPYIAHAVGAVSKFCAQQYEVCGVRAWKEEENVRRQETVHVKELCVCIIHVQ